MPKIPYIAAIVILKLYLAAARMLVKPLESRQIVPVW